jgi:stress response protein SCP2
MAVSLKKGEGVSLRKSEHDLSQVTIGLGWDVAEETGGFLGSLFKKKPEEYDLDAIAFVLAADGKVKNLGNVVDGRPTLVNGDVVFYNSQRHPSGNIWLTGDNRTGAGDGDDEQIIVKLANLDAAVQRVLFVVTIYDGIKKNQNFGKVKNAYIRAVDGRGKEIARYDISGNAAMEGYRALTFAEVVREGDSWAFRAIGTPHATDRFIEILKSYT